MEQQAACWTLALLNESSPRSISSVPSASSTGTASGAADFPSLSSRQTPRSDFFPLTLLLWDAGTAAGAGVALSPLVPAGSSDSGPLLTAASVAFSPDNSEPGAQSAPARTSLSRSPRGRSLKPTLGSS
eukprot:2809249-Prymnesium_polylepis.1